MAGFGFTLTPGTTQQEVDANLAPDVALGAHQEAAEQSAATGLGASPRLQTLGVHNLTEAPTDAVGRAKARVNENPWPLTLTPTAMAQQLNTSIGKLFGGSGNAPLAAIDPSKVGVPMTTMPNFPPSTRNRGVDNSAWTTSVDVTTPAGNRYLLQSDNSYAVITPDGKAQNFASWGALRTWIAGKALHSPYRSGNYTEDQILMINGFAEPRTNDGQMMAGSRHAGPDNWWGDPPSFPWSGDHCVWRTWVQGSNNPGDYFLCYVGALKQRCSWPSTGPTDMRGVADSVTHEVVASYSSYGPGSMDQDSACRAYLEWQTSGVRDALFAAATAAKGSALGQAVWDWYTPPGLPPPPPSHFYSSKGGETYYTLPAQVGLLAGGHNAGGLAPNKVLCAPAHCFWFTDSKNTVQLRYVGPVPCDPRTLPLKLYGPLSQGGYTPDPNTTSLLADSDHYWTADPWGYVTGQTAYDFGAQVANIAKTVGPIALTAAGAVLTITGVGAPIGALVTVGGAAAMIAAGHVDPVGPGTSFKGTSVWVTAPPTADPPPGWEISAPWPISPATLFDGQNLDTTQTPPPPGIGTTPSPFLWVALVGAAVVALLLYRRGSK